MRAAVVRAFGAPPEWSEWPEPTAGPHQTVVTVTAAAVSPVVRGRASGTHYSLRPELPFVAGVDGVGRTPDGQRVYFILPPPPQGALAERVAVDDDHLLPLPDDLDDGTAAAAAIPGMSCWLPLTRRVGWTAGMSVLVNGATGAAGGTAVQVARHLGAAHVVATGRDPARLAELPGLGADRVISVADPGPSFQAAVRAAVGEFGIGVVLDYLWGPSAAAIVAAIGAPDPPRGPRTVRFVHIGGASGDTIVLPGAPLRGSGLEILGSGFGSSPAAEVRAAIDEFLRAYHRAGFRIRLAERPIATIAASWSAPPDDRRPVYRIAGAGGAATT